LAEGVPTVGSFDTVRLNDGLAEELTPFESVSLTETLNVPEAVGLQLIEPVVPLQPVGSPVQAYVYTPDPWLGTSEMIRLCPTSTAVGAAVGVEAIGSAYTANESALLVLVNPLESVTFTLTKYEPAVLVVQLTVEVAPVQPVGNPAQL
jgi:hypothetical protein